MDVGEFPLAIARSPDGQRYVLLLSGWHEQGLQVIDRATGQVLQTLAQPAGFLGLAFAPDGHSLYASGGNQDVVYRYTWAGDTATLRDSLVLEMHAARAAGTRYPAGLALSPNGRWLYVAENLGDSLAVLDVTTGAVQERVPVGRYPYAVAVAPNGKHVFVSAWGEAFVAAFTVGADGALQPAGHIAAGRHPSALLIDAAGQRLYAASASTDRVTVIDVATHTVITTLSDAPPSGPDEGTTPNALALSDDGARLFVAEADANAIAVFDLHANTRGGTADNAAGSDERLLARVPTGWYPSGVLVMGDTVVALAAKGRGSSANPMGPGPGRWGSRTHPESYTLGQLHGMLTTTMLARADTAELARYTARVWHANGWDDTRTLASYPPITHVVYIIKENRTYDQMLGDMAEGDGDTSLVYFGRAVTPNHHALAARFGLFDRFFVNAEVSADGHNWSTAAYATDYVEKTVASNYSGRRSGYDYEGMNRDEMTDDDVNAPAHGYLWDAAERAGITYWNFGEFVVPASEARGREAPRTATFDTSQAGGRYVATKAHLARHTSANFPGFDLSIPDQLRADIVLRKLASWTRAGSMPQLVIVRLPNDHTSGLRAGAPTPRAAVADNDLALGRVVDALSHSPFWDSTAVFVLEDDAQNGPDHVDSHRSPLFVISPWSGGGVSHRFANTTDVLATIAELLHLEPLSQFEQYGRPLREIWRAMPDPTPYSALTPDADLDARNPARGSGARASSRLDLSEEDRADEDLFNRILWRAMKGDAPYPGVRRGSVLDLGWTR